MRLASALAALLAPCHVAARAVFAHFMVGNTALFEVSDWINNMNLANDAHIDAFALNIAYDWPKNNEVLEKAFQAAASTGFRLFFSFDYAGNGPWPAELVMDLIRKYGSHSAYFQHQSKPFVSTFEGPAQAEDWVTIKQTTPCFFMPDWSSLGAGPASTAAGGVADGLFSWAAWPYGRENITTYIDASYIQALGSKPYMMPVSPWFYTNLPGYDKNWAWRGDDLWYERWQQVLYLQPEFVQIISWNDYGESHYIGPLDDRQYEAFEIGKAPFNYVENMPHDGWRTHLPWLIDTYKGLNPAIVTESAVMWFRKSPGGNCQDGGTTGNTASQLQIEFPPKIIFDDKIFIAALLFKPAELWLPNAGENGGLFFVPRDEWDYMPPNGFGIYRHSIPLNRVINNPEITTSVRASLMRAALQPRGFIELSTDVVPQNSCDLGLANWNAVVTTGESTENPLGAENPLPLSDQVCVEGFGSTHFGDFDALCELTCKYGYCPISACVCTKMGEQRDVPSPQYPELHEAYPANGDMNYAGLCSYSCNTLGVCYEEFCSKTPQPVYIPEHSPFSNPACTGGVAKPDFERYYAGLCSYACNWGFCPMHVCTCTETGPLNIPPPIISPTGKSDNLDDAGLCGFACSRGYCPQPCSYSVPIVFIDDTCSNDQKNMIRTEMSNAYDMAVAARDHLQEGGYFDHFFSQTLRNQPNFAADIQETYRRIADMPSGTSSDYTILVSCDGTKKSCTEKKWYASMTDRTQVMNFCPVFFNDPNLKFSGTVLNDCPSINLRNAHQTKAAVIVHETSHTYYAMRGGDPAVDVAYGYNGCSALPRGLFDRSCTSYGQRKSLGEGKGFTPAICPNQAGDEGLCHADMSAQNADTYAHIAAGIYFTRQCKRTIPHPFAVTVAERADSGVPAVTATEKRRLVEPPMSHNKTRPRHPHDGRFPRGAQHKQPAAVLQARADSCPLMDDFIIWDGSEEDLNSIGFLGYAHFGDSYASGMGTGTTEGDECRVGSNNYGDLVYGYIGDSSLSYERRSCSGDTTDGLYGQIDGWGNAPEVNVVTLTVGGNDLGFSTLVKECVISWGVFTTGGGLRERCLKAEDAAKAHMTDLSDNGLRGRLKEAYVRILRKTGRRDTNLYVAGYPTFFNEETTDCNESSFHWFLGGYKPSSNDWPLNRMVWLTPELRKELNDLVRQLNGVIRDAVDAANQAHGGNQVHFVDMEPVFEDGHHLWCEQGVHEPDSSRAETWFFLSAWPDVDPGAAAAEEAERAALFAQGRIPLPDANTCRAALGANPDPYAVAMCDVAEVIRDDPDGIEAQLYASASADLASGNFNSQNVSGWYPTRQIKTFHPRTPGMYAYRDAVIKKMQEVGQW